MTQKHKIQLFEDKQVRTVWDEELQKWFFSIVDVCGILTEQPDYDHAKNYWKVLKHRLIKEGNESVTKCNQLKLVSPKDGECCLRRKRINENGMMREEERIYKGYWWLPSEPEEQIAGTLTIDYRDNVKLELYGCFGPIRLR